MEREMKTAMGLWAVAVAGLVAACSSATEGPGAPGEPLDQTARRELGLNGKPSGSCSSKYGTKTYCGGKSKSGACWCDAKCVQFGDCCADADATCSVIPVGGECAPAACGPALGMPNQLCADGVHTSGPTGNCIKNADGTCGWEVLSCPSDVPQFCGGIAAFPCPAGYVCVDNPNDGCDPQNGGADCGGICVVPAPDSCVGHCDGQAPEKCWCDSLCQKYGDCCGDYAAACL
jgi:Somatomedin B domain